jgi:AmmeMemoRadiSam system protein B
VQILPISLGQASLADWMQLGQQLGQSLSDFDDQVLLLASSDMNHFKSAVETEQIDRRAIEKIEKFAPEELYTLVRKENISMCGVTAVTVMLEAARTLGATSCQLLDYNHSGTINGDMDSVVGYASFLVT